MKTVALVQDKEGSPWAEETQFKTYPLKEHFFFVFMGVNESCP
jgi:hypothetical protein